jgi:hypothetical protein
MLSDLLIKKSILYVIDGLEFGGGERLFTQIINALSPEKYQIFLASHPGSLFPSAIQNSAAKFIATDFSKRMNYSLITKLAKIIKTYKIDIVHGQGARA